MDFKLDKIKDYLQIAKAISDDMAEYQSFDADKAFYKTKKRITKSRRQQLFMKSFSRIAVILVLPLLSSTIILSYLFINKNEVDKEITYHTVTSAPGLITRLELPDKSRVWLNAESSLRYPSHFSEKERTVYLSGEGYFDIESDKASPFFVTIDNQIKVKAYGTKFNVNAYRDDLVMETVLEDGNVDLIINNQSAQLTPGELATFDKVNNKISVLKINTDEKTSWKDGVLIFRNATLEEVLKVLSRRYSVDIKLHKKSSETYRFRAKFTNETITQILSYLKLAAPIEWSFTDIEQNDDSSYTRQKIDLWLKEK